MPYGPGSRFPARTFWSLPALGADPARIDRLADRFAAHFELERHHILGWAIAHTALSTFWHHSASTSFGNDLTMLPLLLEAFERS